MEKNPIPTSSSTIGPTDNTASSSIFALPSTSAETSAATTAVTDSVQESQLNTDKDVSEPPSQPRLEDSSQVSEGSTSKDHYRHHDSHHHKKHHHHHHHGHEHHRPHSHHHKKHRHKHHESTDGGNDESQSASTSASHLIFERQHALLEQLRYLKEQKLRNQQLQRRIDPDTISIQSSSVSSVMPPTEDGTVKPTSVDNSDPLNTRPSQTGLIDSIGRPFNENSKKFLAILGPGNEFMLTRRASEVRLRQLPLLTDLDLAILLGYEKLAKIFTGLIAGAGSAFFILLIYTATASTPMEYYMFFFKTYPACLAMFILAGVQPFAVAPACRYALINLKHIRTYYIRVPPSLVLPFGVFICSMVLIANTESEEGEIRTFLVQRMSQYYDFNEHQYLAKETWDSIQSTLSCCGYDGFKDWKQYIENTLPKSCCENESPSCSQSSSNLHRSGCKGSYTSANLFISVLYFLFSFALLTIQGLSVLMMRRLWKYIGNELYDGRPALSIFGGMFCSLCVIEDSDEEEEGKSEMTSSQSLSRHSVMTGEESQRDESVSSQVLSQERESYQNKTNLLETSSSLSMNVPPSEHNSQLSQQPETTGKGSASQPLLLMERSNKVAPSETMLDPHSISTVSSIK